MASRDPHQSTLHGGSVHQDAHRGAGAAPQVPALALVWSQEEPQRIGEVLCLARGALDVPFTIGRATEAGEDGALPLSLCQLRPFSRVDTGPLRGARVSRWQLRVTLLADDELLVERTGRGVLRVNGHEVERALAGPGDVIEALGRFALLFTRRPAAWPQGEAFVPAFPFGGADACGVVGESPAVWQLRRQIAFVAARGEHVLVHGPSGAGKELVVRALHGLSPRRDAPLVARNAATFPESLIDAELFGNLRDYPNPGMPDRVGLLGEAHGGALFLDEIGELPHALQARLLRVMDGGEYQRLGEARRRSVDLRLLGATNRDPEALKHDLLARFIHRVQVPGLDDRREDVPLLVRHVLRRLAVGSPELRAFFVDDEPQPSAELITALIWRRYTAHLRELTELLWRAIAASPGQVIVAPPGVAEPPPARAPETRVLPTELDREQIVAALAACGGVREQAWRILGLRSRDQLKRLLKKFDIP
jgi:energy-coupling factor transporter ATP-binding protein EcfA2